ncbi:MAG TPA: HAD family hydrolase [Anaerolineales bacterium]|jgi:HAD superfamily hydrolase (TIGR01509 family)|nr:HAD family hydrolase [Anaerolineales bacterium]HQX16531.1 HAD family hydrolase [Anaerolineales bacterium]
MPLDLPRIQALCFDVDGTLSDTDDLYKEKARRFFPKLLFGDPDHAARRFVMWAEAPGNALLGLADTLGIDDEMVAVIDWMSRRRHQSAKKFLLVPGVDGMLAQLKGRHPMSVVSARDEKGTMRFLEQFDLVKYFDAIVTGLSAEHTKPYPDPILFAAKRMGVKPDACLMIGDTTVDMRAGKSAGAQAVGVLCGFGEKDELLRFGADLILETTSDLARELFPDPEGAVFSLSKQVKGF